LIGSGWGGVLTATPGALREARTDVFFVALARETLRVLVIFFVAMFHFSL